MLKLSFSSVITSAFLSLTFLGATPALALSALTFVSGKGVDSGTCALASTPCRTFQFALAQTRAGGEIKTLDPASYGGLIINKSISITGVEGAGIFQDFGSDIAIRISAGPNDYINLSHLILDGFNTTTTGIGLVSGGSLTIDHCIVRNLFVSGITVFLQSGAVRFLIKDTLVSDNRVGINGLPQRVGSVQGALDHVLLYRNSEAGLEVCGPNTAGSILSTGKSLIFAFRRIPKLCSFGTI